MDVRIVVVDDDRANVELLRRMLERAGYPDVVDADDPAEAIELCVAEPTDLLLLDLHMQGHRRLRGDGGRPRRRSPTCRSSSSRATRAAPSGSARSRPARSASWSSPSSTTTWSPRSPSTSGGRSDEAAQAAARIGSTTDCGRRPSGCQSAPGTPAGSGPGIEVPSHDDQKWAGLGLAAVLFGAIFLLRIVLPDPEHPIALLYVDPGPDRGR